MRHPSDRVLRNLLNKYWSPETKARPMTVRGAHEKILMEVAKLEGVEASPHRFGGTEFRLGRRELGHVHGDHQADIAFPMDVRNRLVAEGKAEPHHVIPQSGWVTFRFRKEEDVEAAVELFRLSYLEANKTKGRGSKAETGTE